jgi:cysteine desulfurase
MSGRNRPADLMAACPSLALSSGSASTSAEIEPSYVLRALGLPDDSAAASIRVGLGRFTTEKEVDFAAETSGSAAPQVSQEGMTRTAAGAT